MGPLSLTITGTNESGKVGDTLTATVSDGTAGTGVYTYKWTINGQNPASGETFVVPATAKYGDEIKVTVTNEAGDTASDVVYVGGLTILSVEPTTAATGAVGYKYVRVTFSKALDSLDSSEITIRHAKSNQLFSIESVKLSSDGTFADVVLYGSYDSDGTTFLKANQPYVCTLTKNGETASLGFEIPGFVSDAYVKSVDVEKNTIKIGNSDRTNQNYADNVNVAYTLPSSFEGNLGTLVGNTVSFYYDADYNISDFEVQDQAVVIGAFKYNVPSGSQSYDDNYFSQGDDKYYLKENSSASSNWTHVYSIYDGTTLGPVKNTVYQYAKLVLNPDGTVAQAALLPAWTNMIFVTSIDGNVVTESKSKSKDFKGFTIVKDDAYVTTADIEEGDVIYWYSNEDTGVKFAEIYNNSVTGDLTKTYSRTAILDGTSYTYDWDDAYAGRFVGQYLKDGKYTNLEEKVLIGYEDEEAVTFTLNRLGNVVKAEGTTGEEVSNTKEYMLTANAVGYKAAGTSYIKFKVSDGSTKSTITVPIDDLKKINGVTLAKLDTAAGDATTLKDNKVYLGGTGVAAQDDTALLLANWNKGTGANPPGSDANIEHFIGTDDGAGAQTGTALSAIFPEGTLLKVTTNEDGDVTGIATSVSKAALNLGTTTVTKGDVDAADVISPTIVPTDPTSADQVFKPGLTTIVTAGGKKLSISDDAEVWIANDDFSTVKKQTYAEYTGTSKKAQNTNVLIVPSGTTVKQVVILDSKTTLGDADVAEKAWGVVTEALVGVVDDDHPNSLKKLTVLDPSGEKVVYEDIKSDITAGTVETGDIAFIESDSTGQVIRINNAADMTTEGVSIVGESNIWKAQTVQSDKTTEFDSNATLYVGTPLTTTGEWLVEAADGAIVAKFDGSKVTTTSISAINNEESMDSYNTIIYNKVRKNGQDVESSVIVAIKDSATAAYAAAKTKIDAAATTTTLTLPDALSTGDDADDWGLATEAALAVAVPAIAGFSFDSELAEGETLTSTTAADTNKIAVTVSEAGYSKTWTITATDTANATLAATAANAVVLDVDMTGFGSGAAATGEDSDYTYTYTMTKAASGNVANGPTASFGTGATASVITTTTGTNTTAGTTTYSIVVTATDGEGISGTANWTLVIGADNTAAFNAATTSLAKDA